MLDYTAMYIVSMEIVLSWKTMQLKRIKFVQLQLSRFNRGVRPQLNQFNCGHSVIKSILALKYQQKILAGA